VELGIVFVLLGAFVLMAIGSRWDWFVNHYKVRGIFEIFGKTGGILFYVILGSFFLIVGILMMMGVVD
jgi:hypothetical protein